MALRWVFDPAPPSGKRTGGDAAEYSFHGRIDILVRETVQNSLDARLSPNAPVEVTFRIVDLTSEAREAFLDAIGWETLEDNLNAVPNARGGLSIHQALERLNGGALRLLVIEDRGTRGLEGPEDRINDTDSNPFCALVRDELYSDKEGASAGGSFGLGKSVLWSFSGLKTVLFASVPSEPPRGRQGLRLVGRASLPWHETSDDGKCTGDGWFGVSERPNTPERRAISVWSTDAERIARDCCCLRNADATGLTAVIVGFSEPGEEDRGSDELKDSITAAALESFWPAIAEGRLIIDVEQLVNERVEHRVRIDPLAAPGYRQLSELLGRFRSGHLRELEQLGPGEEAIKWIKLELPARSEKPQHPQLQSDVAVLVRVLEDGEDAGPAANRIARFRGPGMVIRSDQRANLALGARPYVAAVLAGEAAGSVVGSVHADRFLRAAEPPAHDEWVHDTRRIKEEYNAHGTGAKLDRFEKAIRETITRLVTKPQNAGGALPRAVLKFLRFGGADGGGNARFLSVTHHSARVAGEGWEFGVRCRRIRTDANPWVVTVKLKYGRDGGGADSLHAIGVIAATGASTTIIENGDARLTFPPDITQTTIKGATDPARLPALGTRAVLSIHVDGEALITDGPGAAPIA